MGSRPGTQLEQIGESLDDAECASPQAKPQIIQVRFLEDGDKKDGKGKSQLLDFKEAVQPTVKISEVSPATSSRMSSANESKQD